MTAGNLGKYLLSDDTSIIIKDINKFSMIGILHSLSKYEVLGKIENPNIICFKNNFNIIKNDFKINDFLLKDIIYDDENNTYLLKFKR